MATYSLSIYRITINKHNRTDEYEYLDCFDDGKNLIDIINGMFNRWHLQRHLSKSLTYVADDKRVSRIKQDGKGGFIHYHVGPCVSGIIESGAYGTEESIINYKTGVVQYHKKKDDAPMVPFYFCFYIPRHSTYGYLVLERIGINGIFTMLSDAVKNEVGKLIAGRYVMKIEPFIIKPVLDKNLTLMSPPSKMFLKGVKSGAFAAGVPIQGMVNNNSVEAEIVLSIRDCRSSWFGEIFNTLVNRKNGEKLVVDNIECRDVAFQVMIDGRPRKVSVCDMSNLGTNMDITREVTTGADGYPVFKSIEKEANRLISYIKNDGEKV